LRRSARAVVGVGSNVIDGAQSKGKATKVTAPIITTERQRELIEKLTRLVARRATEAGEIRERHTTGIAANRQHYEDQRRRTVDDFQRQHARVAAAFKQAREDILFRYETEGFAVAQEEERFDETETHQLADFLDDAKSLRQHRFQELQRAFKEQVVHPKAEYAAFKQHCEQRGAELQVLVAEAQKIVSRRCEWPEPQPAEQPPAGLSKHDYIGRASSAIDLARAKIYELQQLPAPKFLEDGWPILIFLFGAVMAVYPSWLLLGKHGWIWAGLASVLVPLLIAIVTRQVIRPIARRQTLRVTPEFQQGIAHAQAELGAALIAARSEGERAHRQLVDNRNRDLAAAKVEYKYARRDRKSAHQARMKKATAEYAVRRKAIEEKFERQLSQVEHEYPPQIERLEREFESRLVELSAAFRQKRQQTEEQFQQEWNELVSHWTEGLTEFRAVIDAMNEHSQLTFPDWQSFDAATWQPPVQQRSDATSSDCDSQASDVTAIPFGRYTFDLEGVEGAAADEAELELPRTTFHLPAVLSYPDQPSLLVEAEGDGRDAATQLFQNVMLRMLTAFPPGKVRFTIIDPIGLGQNFSAFMHLADYDERLVASRIWTESSHINQRLADLTEHMENVIQKYLRNEFASIQEYNRQAGEVAEPLQVLVVANFPANFSDEAARRLVSIASSGARCGVYTLISTDTKQRLRRNFDLADLEAQAETLVWDAESSRFRSKHADLAQLPLELVPPPADDQFTDVIRAVGRLAKDAARVEVPFESVTVPASQWWTADSRAEIEAPLGRAGAKKLQSLRLGKGTSQHVLIAGKTGSGKSTLLNALITNLAIHYSPDELQFYLIDFKKGVEFKAYAEHRLPHARVIAIESEREFGMSVLERLDLELKRRGDLFRQQGVQDVKGFRNAQPKSVMPRILLVIDEFQEFFTTDDKIAHDAALLLDRLVRQGRAFGIHVLLGSQTLAGAYSLARSTIGQMAVRIALQCSESDAHLILSEDNTAARLLSRPGEAIYNDANGLFEGNHPFQVVWLSDQQREGYLKRLAEKAREQKMLLPPAVVFEGNAVADPADNPVFAGVLRSDADAYPDAAPRAWLGAAVAIKDPINVAFRRHAGANLLIVGQQEELAEGLLANCIVGVNAQLAHDGVPRGNGSHRRDPADRLRSFYILDASRIETQAGQASTWQKLIDQLALNAEVVSPRQSMAVVQRIADEVDRRVAAGDSSSEPIFLVIDNLAKFRDLKKSDDFGMSFDDSGSSGADKRLATILREGPAVGVHAIIWCDSFNNVGRWLERGTLRDMELRVLFQMSASDSSNLMDSPAASKLGPHLALLHSEEQGFAEKFRPYGLPSEAWLTSVREQLARQAAASKRRGADPALN
jgi:S-DNA-T family DNA segregation ATPase FtsK/SpoIIIE